MRRLLVLLGAALALVATVPTIDAGARATPRVETKLEIFSYDEGFFGYVRSADRSLCAKERRVVIFRVGEDTDQRIGATRAYWEHGWAWSFETRGLGSFYAKAPRTEECQGAVSETQDRLLQGPGDVPICPEVTTDVCRVPRFEVFIRWRTIDGCNSFDLRVGWHCIGELRTSGGHPFAIQGGAVDLTWATSRFRFMSLGTVDGNENSTGNVLSGLFIEEARMERDGNIWPVGWIIDSGRYPGRDLCAYRTGPLPATPGEPGARFRFDYNETPTGLRFFVEGYLYLRKREPNQRAPCQ